MCTFQVENRVLCSLKSTTLGFKLYKITGMHTNVPFSIVLDIRAPRHIIRSVSQRNPIHFSGSWQNKGGRHSLCHITLTFYTSLELLCYNLVEGIYIYVIWRWVVRLGSITNNVLCLQIT